MLFSLSPADFKYIKDLILETFPDEKSINVYVEDPTHASKPRGRLYGAYSSYRSELIEAGMIDPARRLKKVQESRVEEFDEGAQDRFDALKVTVTPWDRVERLWSSTFTIRMNHLKISSTFDEYLKSFPCLADYRSKCFLAEDGTKKMEEAGWNGLFNLSCILNNFSNVFAKGKPFVPSMYESIYEMIADESVNQEIRSLLAVSFLPFCLGKIQKKRKRGTNQAQSEALELSAREELYVNFFPIFNNLEEIQNYAKSKKRGIFPFGYLILNFETNTLMSAIQIGDFWWVYESAIEGFDSYFKIYFALDIKFNPETKALFWIIQKLMYRIESEESERQNASIPAQALLNSLQSTVSADI